MKIPPAILVGGAGAVLSYLQARRAGQAAPLEQAILHGLGEGINAQAGQFKTPEVVRMARQAAALAHAQAQEAADGRGWGARARARRALQSKQTTNQPPANTGPEIKDAEFTVIEDEDEPL